MSWSSNNSNEKMKPRTHPDPWDNEYKPVKTKQETRTSKDKHTQTMSSMFPAQPNKEETERPRKQEGWNRSPSAWEHGSKADPSEKWNAFAKTSKIAKEHETDDGWNSNSPPTEREHTRNSRTRDSSPWMVGNTAKSGLALGWTDSSPTSARTLETGSSATVGNTEGRAGAPGSAMVDNDDSSWEVVERDAGDSTGTEGDDEPRKRKQWW